MPMWMSTALLVLAASTLAVAVWSAWRAGKAPEDDEQAFERWREASRAEAERLERELRDEMARASQAARQDLAALQSQLLALSNAAREGQDAALRRFGD